MIEYNVHSEHAEEFIHDGEIRATLEYAREHRADKALIEEILLKAEQGNGITHREAAVLIEVEDKDIEERMYAIARRLKERIYGNRIVMFAPLYLSNHCVNGCNVYIYTAYSTVLVVYRVDGVDRLQNILNRAKLWMLTCLQCQTLMTHIL